MIRLQKRIEDFQQRYEESKNSIEQKIEYICRGCRKRYSTENGLHNHNTKNKCKGSRQRRNRNRKGISRKKNED